LVDLLADQTYILIIETGDTEMRNGKNTYTLNGLETMAQFEEDRTANVRIRGIDGKSEWLRVVYAGIGQFGYFLDKGRKTTVLSRTMAIEIFNNRKAAR
jgi:hypothetical protein